eukprot:1297410-Amorphochlora_amoeboformis.AAC.1
MQASTLGSSKQSTWYTAILFRNADQDLNPNHNPNPHSLSIIDLDSNLNLKVDRWQKTWNEYTDESSYYWTAGD